MNATTTTTTYTAEQLANIVAQMSDNYTDRKVNVTDINSTEARGTVAAVANDLVATYTGTFQYMVNMRQYLSLGLTDAQVAGVLNCAIADHRYAQRKAAVKQAEEAIAQQPARTYDHSKQYVPDGWYTLVGPKGGHRTLRVTTIVEKSDGIKQWLAYLAGPDNVGDYLTIGTIRGNEVSLFRKNTGKYADIVAAAKALVKNIDKLGEFGKAYAVRSGKCYVCNRKLTEPESIRDGIGPVCRKNRGL